jgi:outer membrane lipoprotein-sorting protein
MLLVAVVAAWMASTVSLLAADNARDLVAESQRRTTSKSERYEGLLQSFSKSGKVTEKRWTFERLGSHGQSKSVIRFTAPAQVKGVALLIVNHPDKASDQWMWTPAIERDRRIAMQDRSTRFFGTDFSFEDLEERDVDQFDYTLLGEEAVGGAACWKIESAPKKTKSSQYTKSIVWLRKDNYVPARIEFYVKNDVVRRLDHADIRNVQGVWTAHELTMTDVKRGTHTRLALSSVAYDVPLKDSDFTLRALRQ